MQGDWHVFILFRHLLSLTQWLLRGGYDRKLPASGQQCVEVIPVGHGGQACKHVAQVFGVHFYGENGVLHFGWERGWTF